LSFTLQQVVTAARDRSQFFNKPRIGDALCARWCTEFQNELIAKALRRDAHYLEQSIGIVLALSSANTPGVAGANTSGGLPADVDDAGNLSYLEAPAGALVEALDTDDDDAVVMVADRVVTSATATTVSSTGAGRTVNEDVDRLVVIVAGKGAGQQREVVSNTATQWTVAAWETIPDATSVMRVVVPELEIRDQMAVVTDLPATVTKAGYLVKLDAAGVPYVDYTSPLVAYIDQGVPLPSAIAISGGTVRYTTGDDQPLCIATYGRRFDPPEFPAVWHGGQSLFLCGNSDDWNDVVSLEVRYSPIAPAFTALADFFLLPDPPARGGRRARRLHGAARRRHGRRVDRHRALRAERAIRAR
jgi:hypothetical protein